MKKSNVPAAVMNGLNAMTDEAEKGDSSTDIMDTRRWKFVQGDCLEVMATMPADSVDLVFFSPPYSGARLYLEDGSDLCIAKEPEEWVAWMLKVFIQCRRLCKGLVACVCECQTRGFRWEATPALLMADLHRAGFNLRRPCIFHRVGIPGSGGPDWLRADTEFIICASRPGKLPWSDNTAMGHPPKWAPGGEMSYRLTDGTRRNQCGGSSDGKTEDQTHARRKDGSREKRGRPSHKIFEHAQDGTTKGDHDRLLNLTLANPGNSIDQTYSASEVADMLEAESDWRHHIVGGGVMGGDEFASQNEAPYPESLCEFFIRSFCQEGGTVLDPTCGSGTTIAVAHRWKRHGIGIDLRQSQIDLSRRRLEVETPMMFT